MTRATYTKLAIEYRDSDYNAESDADYNADYNIGFNAISVPKLHYREYNPEQDLDSYSTIPSYTTTMTIDNCNLTSESSPSNRCSLRSHLRIVAGGATTCRRSGSPYWNLKQPLPQTITIPEAQERCTIRSIHQLRRLAAASAPGHESTSGLRERQ